ncbi:hypothetical protein GCM10020001_051300 [Nonomuraea salmonea]
MGEGADVEPADDLAAQRLEVCLRGLDQGEDALRVLGEQPRRVREPHAAAVALHEPGTGLALQLGDLLADRRGGDHEGVGRRSDRTVDMDGVKGFEPVQVQHVSHSKPFSVESLACGSLCSG